MKKSPQPGKSTVCGLPMMQYLCPTGRFEVQEYTSAYQKEKPPIRKTLQIKGFTVSKWRDSNPRPFGPERRIVSIKFITFCPIF